MYSKKTKLIFSLSIALCCVVAAQAQSTQTGVGAAGHSAGVGGVATRYVGWDASVGSNLINLNVEHRGIRDISFLTGGGTHMIIRGSAAGAAFGFVGIGTGTPLFRLDVNNNINVNTGVLNTGYRINGIPVLQINGTRNVFVGEGAGFVNANEDNVFVGFRTGFSNVTGDRNTYVGSRAGQNTVNGRFNTYVGADAGQNMTGGNSNTFVGEHCGWQQTGGGNNTYMGVHAGNGAVGSTANNCVFIGTNSGGATFNGITNNTFVGFFTGGDLTTGNNNVFMGTNAGRRLTTGSDNVFIGNIAAINHTTGSGNVVLGRRAGFFTFNTSIGDNNVLIGNNATVGAANRTNGIAIGAGTVVVQDNTMILGNNVMRVGIGLSGDPTGPTAPLEINTALPVSATSSGLKFRDMPSSVSPIANPGNGVLAVDADGDVIYVTASAAPAVTADNGATINPSGNVQWGQVLASGTAGQLIHNTEVPFNGFNVQFTDPLAPAAGLNRFQIGRGIPTGEFYKFYVYNQIEETGSRLETDAALIPVPVSGELLGSSSIIYNGNSTSVNHYGHRAESVSSSSLLNVGIHGIARNAFGIDIGVRGEALVNSPGGNVGGQFEAQRGSATRGVQGIARNSNLVRGGDFLGEILSVGGGNVHGVFALGTGGMNATGVEGIGDNSVNCIGVAGRVNTLSPFTAFAAGVLGEVTSGPGNGLSLNQWGGYFNGDVFTTGTYEPSDRNLKENVKTIESSLDIVNKLNPVTYNFIAGEKAYHLSQGKQYGFISQEIKEILPELTKTVISPAQYDSAGKVIRESKEILGLNYNGFIAILTKAIQEQQQEIDALKEIVANNGTLNAPGITPGTNVVLSDAQSIVIEQNVPNPFAEQTTINYFLPDNVGKAQMLFYNAEGKLINSVELTARGKAHLNVFASDLSSGVYTYTLVADGKIIDSKRMVRN